MIKKFVLSILLILSTMLFSCGKGTSDLSPNSSIIYIENYTQLVDFAEQVNNGNDFEGKTVILQNNIDAGSDNFIGIGKPGSPFKGVFDGNYKTIKIKMDYNISDYMAFVRMASEGAIIKNLTLDGDIIGKETVGSIVAVATGNITIENCVNYADIVGTGNDIGGIIGLATTTSFAQIKNCKNYGQINGRSAVGGIIGQITKGTIEKSINIANVAGSGNAIGGIVGAMYGGASVKNSTNEGTITGAGLFNGIAGKSDSGIIENCDVSKGSPNTL